MSSSITATVENGAIKLPPGVHWPDGTRVTIQLEEKPAAETPREDSSSEANPESKGEARTLAELLAPFIGIADDLPPDFAINHDHYIHGARKQWQQES